MRTNLVVIAVLAWLVVGTAAARAAPDTDTDHDGLSDFQERHKYFTDPAKADSDGDGTPDGAWDERREYSYTIRTVVRVMRPVDESALSDDYQDARILEETPTWVKLEVVHYPFNTVAEALHADPDWREPTRAMTASLAPGKTSNWDAAMRESIVEGLRKVGIDPDTLDDRTLVERAVPWLLDHAKTDNGQFTAFFTSFPDGKPAVHPGCEAGVEAYDRAGRSIEGQWAHDLFAKGMFENGTRGSCTSTAIYLNACLRAIGVPTRIVFGIPAIDRSDPDEVAMLSGIRHPRVRETMALALTADDSWCNHSYDEVFVGGRWRRLNYAHLGQNAYGPAVFGLWTHVLTVNDWSEADVAPTIGRRQANHVTDDVFGHENPYSTVEMSDRFGVHAAPERIGRGADIWRILTIDRALWTGSPGVPARIDASLSVPDGPGYALLHVKENRPGGGLGQYAPFWRGVDRRFLLRAADHDDLRAEATHGYWAGGWFFLEVPPASFAAMPEGVPFSLVPAIAGGDMHWAVAEGVRLARTADMPLRTRAPDSRTLAALLWTDSAGGRRLLGEETPAPLGVLARVEGYDGDWKALTSYQRSGESGFELVAEGSPPLPARMRTGGITIGSEAWVLLDVVRGAPRPGVSYRLRSPDERWKVEGALPPR